MNKRHIFDHFFFKFCYSINKTEWKSEHFPIMKSSIQIIICVWNVSWSVDFDRRRPLLPENQPTKLHFFNMRFEGAY